MCEPNLFGGFQKAPTSVHSYLGYNRGYKPAKPPIKSPSYWSTTLFFSGHLLEHPGFLRVNTLGVGSPFFSTIFLSKNRPFSLGFWRFSRKKDPWEIMEMEGIIRNTSIPSLAAGRPIIPTKKQKKGRPSWAYREQTLRILGSGLRSLWRSLAFCTRANGRKSANRGLKFPQTSSESA